jgi:gingipain R
MKKFFAFSLCISVLFGSFAQQFSILHETENELLIQLSTPIQVLPSVNINGHEHISFSKIYQILTTEIGAPELPLFSSTIALPAIGNPTIEVIYGESFIELNDVLVAPSKGTLKRNVNPNLVPYSFGAVYEENVLYPVQSILQHEPFIFRAARGMTLQASPYQYNPVTKVLRLYEEIKIKVSYNIHETGLNEIVQTWNDPISMSMTNSLFLNREHLRYTVKDEEGEMLIITHPAFEEEIMPFAHWKNQKGIKTTVVNTSATGTTAASIKTYITDFSNSNPNTLYLVLVGDHQQIPAYSYGDSWGEQLWSDSYYGQIIGNDYYPELFVGRISAENAMQVRTQVERTLEYEKAPLGGDWMEKAVGVGSDEGDGYGNLGLADWDHLRQI